MASELSHNKGISDVTHSVPTTSTRILSRNPHSSLSSLDDHQKNDTLVSMQELIPTQVGSNLEVEAGIILKLLDIASCLSAEKHARKPCVTVTLDDLIFENTVKAGDIVHFTAKVSRAFTTSMEVSTSVEVEDACTGMKQRVCRAYFTYVVQSDQGGKLPLPPVYPNTPIELKEFLLASERRRSRLTRKVSIQEKKLVHQPHSSPGLIQSDTSPPTYAETVKVVVPSYTNHHGTTFGGQLMEWMASTAMIAALRFAHKPPVLLAVDSIHFRAPSRVGDRVRLRASVNNVFNKSMEVGIRLTAYKINEEERHISSAYFYLGVRDEDFNLINLPKLTPATEIEKRRAAEAYGRYHLRLDRRTFVNDKKIPLLDPSSKDQFLPLVYGNISSLMKLYTLTGWQKSDSNENRSCTLYQYEDSQFFALKCEGEIAGVDSETGFKLLQQSLLEDRKTWDKLCISADTVKSITNDDVIVRLIMKPLDHSEKIRDFVLLASKRSPIISTSLDPYAIAFSSVELDLIPLDPSYERGQVISSGYVCSQIEGHSEKFNLCYLHQISSTVLPFVATDLMGLSSVVEIVFIGLQKYILGLIAKSHSEDT
ncbi:Acyl-coenzyme A thioesterase 11 [Oopsacas minuta]|uniref:Acyl-coenzyme A thioesterase 11 n=1 Tax=Oopsacas minuta TaxID=111878 RepID=A0AAV7KD41_9METZ|nr:Acyl-coenzyme A thioesterase 11 [Oopsacas minuta]